MEFNVIKIENSFNKNKDSGSKKPVLSESSLESQQTFLKTESINNSSLTFGGLKENNISIPADKKPGALREIIIGVASAVIGALIIYFIFGIK